MHRCPKMLFTTALLVAASISVAQEPYHSPDPDVIARLSYDYSGTFRHGNVRHLCIAVSRDREYRIVRSSDDGRTQRLHGAMPKEEFSQLFKLLGAAELRNLSPNHGGLVRQEAETFVAEILADRSHVDAREHEAWRLQWLNGDGENPFPESVSNVVDWLQQFQPKNGQPFEYADYPDVCPGGGLRFLHPSVAANLHP